MMGTPITAGAAVRNSLRRHPLVLDTAGVLARPETMEAPWWPVSRAEILEVYRALARNLASLVRTYTAAGDETGELLAIVLPLFAFDDVISLYHAQAVIRRAGLQGAEIVVPERSRLYRALVEARAPGLPPIVNHLRAGPPRPGNIRTVARYARSLMVRDGLRQRPPALVDWQNDVVLTITNSLAHRHAASEGIVPILGRHNIWFCAIDAGSEGAARAALERHPIGGAVVDAVSAAFAAGGEKIPDFLVSYCRDLFVAMASLMQCQVANAAGRRNHLPANLWTGSGGALWDRILRYAVRRDGGKVTGHDHGFGAGHRADHNKALQDFDSCDRFVTFSEANAAALLRNVDPAMMLRSELPEVIAVPNASPIPTRQARQTPNDGRGRRRAMYVAAGFDGERTRCFPKLPAAIAVDWQRRLFSHLAEHDWQVMYKYHPEMTQDDTHLRDLFGVELLGGRLEDVSGEADLVIVDNPNTTAFGAAMLTDRPVVYIDLGGARLDAEADRLLRRRCAIVQGGFDSDNRVSLDWEALDTAMDEAGTLSDRAFCRIFFDEPGTPGGMTEHG